MQTAFFTSIISISENAKLVNNVMLIIIVFESNLCEFKLGLLFSIGFSFSKDMNLHTSGLEIW